MKRRAAVLLMAFCILLGLPAARATTLEKMSIERMARAANAIARVRCVSNSTVWQHGEIWTLTGFDVEQTWRGALQAQITVRSLGGSIGVVTSTVSGVPRFRPGEEAVLFLEQNLYGDYFVVSWQQGTFRIRRDRRTSDETITEDTASYPTFDPRTRHMETNGVAGVRVSVFRAHVEAAAALAGTR
jgi:hypothetical protein